MMKASSSGSNRAVESVWPYVVAAIMIGYVILLLLIVADDVSATSQVLGAP